MSALAAACAFAVPANAALTISNFTVQATQLDRTPNVAVATPVPVDPVAGSNPDVTVDMRFSSQDGDTPKDAYVSLGTGILANPTAVAETCSQAAFSGDNCPADSQVGEGEVTGTVPNLGSLTLPAYAYLMPPLGSSVAQVGVIVDVFDTPVPFTFPVNVRTSPDVGIDIPISAIPDAIAQGGDPPTQIQLNEFSLTLYGTVDGKAFTRLPTSCSGTTSTVSADSWNAPATPLTGSATLTADKCSSLAYGPQLVATATQAATANNDGNYPLSLTASITQGATDSATSSISMALPSALAVNLNALAAICASPTAPGCQPIGTASVTTPLLAAPLQGSLYLVRSSGLLPTIDAVVPPPFAVTLVGTPTLTSSGLTATFAGIPDVPISALQVTFAGGPGGLLEATPQLCSSSPAISATFTAHDGATAALDPALQVLGCPPASAVPASGPSGAPGSGSSSTPGAASSHAGGAVVKSPTASVSLSSKKPVLTLTVAAGANAPALGSVRLALPGDVKVSGKLWPRGVKANLDGRTLSRSAMSDKGGLTFTLAGKGRKLTVTLTGAVLQVAKRLTSKGSHVKLTFVVAVKDASGQTTTLRLPLVA